MSINVEFKDFEEMKDFARKLLGNNQEAANVPVHQAPVSQTSSPDPVPTTRPAVEAETSDTASADVATDENPEAYTLEDVRARLAELNKGGKRAEVKELLASFGAEKLSEISQEHYGALLKKAEEL